MTEQFPKIVPALGHKKLRVVPFM